MASPYWIKTLLNKTFYQRFFWARLSNYPVIGRAIEYLLFEDDEIFYLPKDNVIPVNQSLGKKEDMVMPSQVLDHFIREANYHWIMDFCICRDSAQCKDYPIDLGCMFLGEAAMDINPKWGRKVTEAEALEHAQKCRDAGLVHLIGRNKLDKVWLNVGPGEKLLTVCNCCPCCCLWKILPDITPSISDKIHRMPGVSVFVTDRCVGCRTCEKENVCFVNAIHVEDGQAVIGDNCRACGRCVEVCPNGSIEMRIENDTFTADTIRKISDVVDVT